MAELQRTPRARHLSAVRAIGLSGQMHGAVALDARRPGAAPCHPLERRPQRRPMRGADGARAAPRRDRRQPRDAGLHGAEAAVDARARAGALRAHRLRAAAQGLAALQLERRARERHVGRFGHAVAGRGARATGPTNCSPPAASRARRCRAWSKAARSRGGCSPSSRSAGACAAGVPIAGGGGDNAASAVGMGLVDAGARLRLARHLGRDLRLRRALRAEARSRGACLLPRAARPLAPDVGDALGLQRRELGRAQLRPGQRSRRCSPRPPRSTTKRAATHPCSCPISPASARRTTTRMRKACSSA